MPGYLAQSGHTDDNHLSHDAAAYATSLNGFQVWRCAVGKVLGKVYRDINRLLVCCLYFKKNQNIVEVKVYRDKVAP